MSLGISLTMRYSKIRIMVTRSELVRFLLAAICCILLLLFLIYQVDIRDYPEEIRMKSPPSITTNNTINDVIRNQKILIEKDLVGYRFPVDIKLENLVMDSGGKPLRSIVVATWRSGSTFLGEVLNSLPGNFYHYEPLLDFGIVRVRGLPLNESAINNIKKLLKCDYTGLNSYIEYAKGHTYYFTPNKRLWRTCLSYPLYCWNETFLSGICKVFPFQSMKLVRLRLNLIEEILKDESVNVKVLLLVRDPRGILQSRKHRLWCPGAADCEDPSLLCADLFSDYEAAVHLQEIYPKRFSAVRYEDLSLNPYEKVKEIFNFFGLDFHNQVKIFLDLHTKTDKGNVSSTYRNSKTAPFHWRTDLNFSEVQYIEGTCARAMKLWGYVRAKNESHMRKFNPITSYIISKQF